MIHWKFAALAAATTALLSFLVGLVGRVSAGSLIFRALISGIVFGALVVGLELLGRRFLPELFVGNAGESDIPEEHEPGAEVDIVLDDDEPSAFVSSEDDETFTEADEENTLVTELVESPGDEGVPGYENSESVLDDGVQEISGLSDVEAGGNEPPSEPTRKNGLPDIEEFSGSFGGIKDNPGMVDSLNSSKASRLQEVDSLEKENDPVTMAQAIRTILHKDQEG